MSQLLHTAAEVSPVHSRLGLGTHLGSPVRQLLVDLQQWLAGLAEVAGQELPACNTKSLLDEGFSASTDSTYNCTTMRDRPLSKGHGHAANVYPCDGWTGKTFLGGNCQLLAYYSVEGTVNLGRCALSSRHARYEPLRHVDHHTIGDVPQAPATVLAPLPLGSRSRAAQKNAAVLLLRHLWHRALSQGCSG